MHTVLALCLLIGFASAQFSASTRESPRVHPSATFEKFRAMGKTERAALTRAGFNLGDCGPLCELDLPGIIAYNGYPVETHTIRSIDNQVDLNVYRIRCGRNFSQCDGTVRPAVMLQHGLLDSGCTWITNPTNEGLAYILADAGYDVWIGNSRGNTYSPCQTDDCWKFSYDEMALYDLPTVIPFILNTTGLSSLSYVGHSQGTTQAFASFSTLPDIAAKVNLFVALAPAVLVHSQQSPLLTLLVDFNVDKLFELFGVKEFLPNSWFLKLVASLFCDGGIFTSICEDVIFALCGDDPSKNHDLNSTRIEVYLTHTPAGTSVQNMAHWGQAVRVAQFQMFDYGTQGNLDHYGQSTPPQYNLTNLAVPTAIFSGGHDYLADPSDVEQLMNMIPKNVQIYNQFIQDYSHLDFVWGVDAATRVYPNILNLLQQYAVSV